jgi:cell wall-associated NlpC family hydrolase
MVSKYQQRILIEARKWLNTPWQHNQKLIGHGVDCVRFIEAVFKDSLGFEFGDINCYAKMPEGDEILIFLQSIQYLKQIPLTEISAGDLLLFSFGKIPYHLGISNGTGFIHADSHHGVTELDSMGRWQRRLVDAFRIDINK